MDQLPGSFVVLATEGASAADNAKPLDEIVRATNSHFKEVNIAFVERYANVPYASPVDGSTPRQGRKHVQDN